MTRLGEELLTQLETVAHEVREWYEDGGHNVSTALNLHRSFRRNNRPRSALSRSLVEDGFIAGASAAGLTADAGRGGSLEIIESGGAATTRIRLRKANRVGGEFTMPVSSDSRFFDTDEDVLYPDVVFVFGFELLDDGLGDLFVAEVLGIEVGKPSHLVLSAPILLGSSPTTPSGFTTDHSDDLPELNRGAAASERSA